MTDPDSAVTRHFPGQPEAVKAAFRLVYEQAVERILAAGDKVDAETGEAEARIWVLSFAEDVPELSAKQRRFLHGVVFKQVAENLVVNGRQFDLGTWKEYARQKLIGQVVDGVDERGSRWVMRQLPGWKKATPQRERVSTEDLSVRQYSAYIDACIAHFVTEFGMEFDINPVERESVRWRDRRKKPRQLEAA